jgi:hypothetical protein
MFGWVKFKFLQIVDLNCSIRLCFFCWSDPFWSLMTPLLKMILDYVNGWGWPWWCYDLTMLTNEVMNKHSLHSWQIHTRHSGCMLTSARMSTCTDNVSVDSPGSYTQCIDDFPITGLYTYNIPDIQSKSPTKWVYEWIQTEFYNMLFHEWQDIVLWVHFTWPEYKTHTLNLRYYAYFHKEVLCNEQYA